MALAKTLRQRIYNLFTEVGGVTTSLNVFQSGSVPTTPTFAQFSLGALNASYVIDNSLGFSAIGIQLDGDLSGTISIGVSNNNTTFPSIGVHNVISGILTTGINANGIYTIDTGGLRYIKVTVSAYVSGTANLSIFATESKARSNLVSINQSTNTAGVTNQIRISTIETEHQKIHEQKMFHFSEVSVLGSGAARNFLFTPAGNTAHWVFSINGQDGLSFGLYEFADNTGFTLNAPSLAWNKSRIGAAASPSGTIQIATVIPALPSPMQIFNTGTASNIQKSIGRASEWDLMVGKVYLFRVVSNNAANTITTEMEWYEG